MCLILTSYDSVLHRLEIEEFDAHVVCFVYASGQSLQSKVQVKLVWVLCILIKNEPVHDRLDNLDFLLRHIQSTLSDPLILRNVPLCLLIAVRLAFLLICQLLYVLATEFDLEFFALVDLSLQLAEVVELQVDLCHQEVGEPLAEDILDLSLLDARLLSLALAGYILILYAERSENLPSLHDNIRTNRITFLKVVVITLAFQLLEYVKVV